jgi:hypothetical protein
MDSTYSYRVHQFPGLGPADETPRESAGNLSVIVAGLCCQCHSAYSVHNRQETLNCNQSP